MAHHSLLLLLLLLGCSASSPIPDGLSHLEDDSSSRWLNAVEAGDTEAAVEAVQAVFEQSEVVFQPSFGWELKPYDEPLNFFDTLTKRVTLGRAPTAEQTAAYWQIYSDRLTGGAWSAGSFFRDAEEARRMASFNQAYLAAHEAGHALAYHYAVNPRWDVVSETPYVVSVHCQELLADRVAAAFLAEVIQSVPRAEAYRERYLELMASIDALIPIERRLQLASLDGCSEVPVLYPQDEATFQNYVSAFFARQRLLLSDRQIELAEALREHFLWRRAAFVARAPDLPGAVVSTLPEPRGVQAPTSSRGRFPLLLDLQRSLLIDGVPDSIVEEGTAYGILADGRVHVVTSTATLEVDTTSAEPPYAYTDLITDTDLRVDGETVQLPDLGPASLAVVQSAIALAEGDLLVLAAAVDAADPDIPTWLRLLRLRQQGSVWRADVGEPFPRSQNYARGDADIEDVLRQPDGTVFVERSGRLYRVELATLAPIGDGEEIDSVWGDLQALDAQGRRLSVLHDVVGRMRPDGGRMVRDNAGGIVIRSEQENAVTLAGSGLNAYRDGPGPLAHLGRVVAMRMTDDGILVVERSDAMRVRRIRLPQP